MSWLDKKSIKQRVSYLQAYSAFGIVALVVFIYVQVNSIAGYVSLKNDVTQFNLDLLQLRRYEKDFIMRRENGDITAHKSTVTKLRQNLEKVAQTDILVENEKVQTTVMKTALLAYQANFSKYVENFTLLDNQVASLNGFTALEQFFISNLSFKLTQDYINFTQLLDTFINQPTESRLSEINRQLRLLDEQLEAKPSKWSEYKAAINTIAQLIITLGIDHDSGLEGAFRRDVHQFENIMNEFSVSLETRLRVLTDKAEKLVTAISVLITIMLLIALWWFGRGIIRPVTHITSQVTRLNTGEREINFKSDIEEFNQLTTLLNQFQLQLIEIDEHRKIEAQYKQKLEQQRDELISALNNIQLMQEQLVQSEKMASLGALVAGVSHEINTPIGVAVTMGTAFNENLRKFLTSLKDGKVTSSVLKQFEHDSDEGLKILQQSLEKASTLIHSFKQVAVDQTSQIRRKFTLDNVFEEVLLTLKHQLKHTNIDYQAEIEEGVYLDSYPGALSQIITNLFNNALIHAFDENSPGHISISAKQKDDQVVIKVSDNGKGIPEKNMAKVFDPFFTTKLGQGGSGLGLNIVYNMVVNILGGKINVYDNEPSGTCFEINMPLISPSGE